MYRTTVYIVHALIAPRKMKVEIKKRVVREEESDDEDERAAVIDTGMFSVKVRI